MKLSQFTPLPPRNIVAMHRRAANWSLALVAVLDVLIAANAWFIGNIPIHLVLTAALLVFGPLVASCQRVVRDWC